MSALLLIDFQRAFEDTDVWGSERSDPDAERLALEILDAFRTAGEPVVHVVHDSLQPASPFRHGSPGFAPLPGFEPGEGESRIVKHENSAFAGTGLDTLLRRLDVRRLVVAGLTTPHCVSTSVRMAANTGFDVTLAGNACASFAMDCPDGRRLDAETVQAVHIASLHGEFCRVLPSDEIVANLSAT